MVMEPPTKRSRAFVDVPVTDNTYYLKVMVPEAVAAAIIGKGGSNMKAMQETGGIVKVSSSGVFFPTTQYRPVAIGGSPTVVDHLLQVVMDRQAEAALKAPAGTTAAEHSVLNLLVPNCTVSRLIGPGGEIRNEMCSQSGAKLSARDRIPGVMERCVSLTGAPEQIQAIARLVIDKINLCPTFREGVCNVDYRNVVAGVMPPAVGKGAGKGARAAQHGYGAVQQSYGAVANGGGQASLEANTIYVPIDGSMAGGFIGRGGSVMKALTAQSGAKISILNENQQLPGLQAHRMIRISGDVACVQAAHAAVAARLQELTMDPAAAYVGY